MAREIAQAKIMDQGRTVNQKLSAFFRPLLCVAQSGLSNIITQLSYAADCQDSHHVFAGDGMSEVRLNDDLSALSARVTDFCNFFRSRPDSAAQAMHGTVAHMHGLCSELSKVHPKSWRSSDLQRILAPAVEIHMKSPFVRRLREWPRGFPGDFETVELLVAESHIPDNTEPTAWVDWYSRNTAIAQQHRNKIWWQCQNLSAIPSSRILSVGCGGGADFNIAPARFRGCEIVLLDFDSDALTLAQRRLERFCSVQTICADVRRGFRRALEFGPFDTAVFGGLFDYLDDRNVIQLLGGFRERASKSESRILFTNIADQNPLRVWMETIADWKLNHRSDADIRRIIRAAGFDDETAIIKRDGTGLTHLIEITVAKLNRADTT